MNIEPVDGTKNLGRSYYSFEQYVSRERMLTYWYQIREILALEPKNMLEIGKGTGIVEHSCKAFGVSIKTADFNANLKPDYVMSVLEAGERFRHHPFDLVLCARVLHHVSFHEFEEALASLAAAGKFVVLTLPVDELRFYFSVRLTSRPARVWSIAFPLFLKRLISKTSKLDKSYYAKLWKIDSSPATKQVEVVRLIERSFEIMKSYAIPEDRSHRVFVLRSRTV